MMGPVDPWTILERKITFTDPRLRIRTDLCLTSRGDVVGPTHVIVSPDRVAIVAMSPKNLKIILVRRYRHGVGFIMAGLPGGEIDRAGGTHELDVAENAAQQKGRKSAQQARLAGPPDQRLEREGSAAALAAAERAAKHELLEKTGYAAGGWVCLLKSHPDSSCQSNIAYCFLATALEQRPLTVLTEGSDEIVEFDLPEVLRLVQQGKLTMDVLHTAALWSAASHIAADRSGRFGDLSMHLRRFFVGDSEVLDGEPVIPVAFPSSTVGG